MNRWSYLRIVKEKMKESSANMVCLVQTYFNEIEIQNKYQILTKYFRLRLRDHVARMEEGWRASKISTGKHIGKRPLGRPRHRWEDNIR